MQQVLSSLTHLSKFGKKLATIDNSAQLYESIFAFCSLAFGCEESAVYLKDATGKTLIFAAGHPNPGPSGGQVSIQLGEGLKGRAVQTGEVQFTVDTIAEGDTCRGPVSETVVPLRLGNEIIGVIDVISSTRRFREADLPVFAVFGELVSAAAASIRLHERLSERTRKLSNVAKAGQTYSGGISIKDHLLKILSYVKEALAPEGCSVRLLDEDGIHLTTAAALGHAEASAEIRIPRENGIWGFAMSTGRPSMIPPAPGASSIPPGSDGYLSEMAVPLMYQGKALGALHLFHSKKAAFNETDLLYAAVFADLAADAAALGTRKVSNNTADHQQADLRLFAETAAVIARTTDFERMFNELFDKIFAPLGFLRAVVLVPDETGQALIEHLARGIGGPAKGMRYYMDSGVAGQAFRTMETVFSANQVDEVTEEAVTEIAAPMEAGDSVIGVLLVTPGAEVDEIQVNAASLLATQLAAAMHNDRMIRRLESAWRRQDALNRASFALNATLSLDDLLAEILVLAVKALHLERCAVLLLDDSGEHLILEAAVGYGKEIGTKIPMGHGITGLAAQLGEPVFVADIACEPRYLESGVQGRSEMAAPLKMRGQVIGVLDTESLTPGQFEKDDLELFAAFAAKAATAVHNTRLFNKLAAANLTLEDNVREMSRLNAELSEYSKRIYIINESLESQLKSLTAIHEAGKAITSSLDLDATLSAILEMTSQIIGSTAGAIKLLDEETKEFRTRAQSGSLTDVSSSCTILEVPLLIGNRKIGIFELICKAHNGVGRDEQKMVETLASQAAIAIENARLFKDTQQIYYDTLKSLAQALEARDDYTRGHSERVSHIAKRIALEMRLDQEDIRTIESAALLHDIGKIGIRDDVLLAPRKLTTEELTAIQEHSAFGNTILAPLKFLGKIRECVRHHHERWDGAGYPDGLKGANIPAACRIIAVADTYDAMTSNRPYRQSLSHETAIHEITHQAGKQFDPSVVEAFLKLTRNGGPDSLLSDPT